MSTTPTGTFRPSLGETHPIVASVNETMATLKIGREKIYQLLNSGELESYRDGGSRKVLWRSIEGYVERRLGEEAKRRGTAAYQATDMVRTTINSAT
ncbi:DNA-binding protein [Bradyrhizobium canariense]|uniref:DNA-binding protein n=1 Tax=Bradyrhizobium canariense TaxID=255045 RepID=A0ABX3XB77_9BRAD|nr:helix-turn-helix domain-containing protein [Bradyrhizobium canariense]OSJ19760.1 DNA-binding protein [Bradyrhizobium canariense]OSJ35916.1 DNA-binding protein [Bradyrhizobium canariense]